MDLKITEELDKAFWLPTKINELAQKGVNNVAHKMVPLLPELQRNRVLRAMEKAIQKEVEMLSEEEFEEFETKIDKLQAQLPKKEVIVFEFVSGDGWTSGAWNVWIFTNETVAAQALYEYVTSLEKYSLEDCQEFVKKQDDSQRVDTWGDDDYIVIYHLECDTGKGRF